MLFRQTQSSQAFKGWLWKDAENRLLLKFSVLATAISFVWLKIIYPYPNFMPPDSNSYLEAAFSNQFINLWAIGYSKFVRLVSIFTSSHFVLVLLQYLMLQASVLYFLFSIRYLLSSGKWAFRCLFAISVINPLLIQIANFISSDALFITLSLVWFTQLLWIVYEPTKKLLFWHPVIILMAFMVRYSGLYYPIISIVVILFSPATKRLKIMSLGSAILLLGLFIGSTVFEYKSKTNTAQYAAFSGWQIASNALYGYAHAKPVPIDKVPNRFRTLHAIVNKHMDSLKHYPSFLRPDKEVAVYYLWNFKSPLRVYMGQLYPKTSTEEFFYKWATMAPLYTSYGRFIIKQHQKEFILHYLWPNFIKYYTPPTKFMSEYNMGNATVEPIVTKWFGWTSNKLPSYYKNKKIYITEPFPVVFAAINIVFVLGFLSFIVLGGFNNCSKVSKRLLWLTVAIWVINMVFSVFAAPIELRYQIFPMVFTLAITWLLINYTILQARKQSSESLASKQIIAEPAM